MIFRRTFQIFVLILLLGIEFQPFPRAPAIAFAATIRRSEEKSPSYQEALRALRKKDFVSAEKIFRRLLTVDPLFHSASGRSAWYWLGQVLALQGQRTAAIQTFERGYDILKNAGIHDWFLNYDLARLYAGVDPDGRVARVTALVYDVLKGANPDEESELWQRLVAETAPLLEDEERLQLQQSLREPTGQPGLKLLRFFRRHDPSPLTEQNELLVVFFQRSEEARKRFPLKAAQSGYDDRGEIYVRLGEPYSILADHSGVIGAGGSDYFVYPYEVWFYTNIDPDLYYTFSRLRGKAHFVMVDGPESIFNTSYKIMADDPRRVLETGKPWGYYKTGIDPFSKAGVKADHIALRLREELYMKLAGQHHVFQRRLYELSNLQTDEDAIQFSKVHFARADKAHVAKTDAIAPGVVFRIGEQTEELPISMSLARFRDSESKARVEIYYSIPNRALHFEQVQNGYRAELFGHIAVFDENYKLIAGEYITESCIAPTTEVIERGKSVNQWNFSLLPDKYNLVLTLGDTTDKRLGVVRYSFKAGVFPGPSLGLSDIELSSHIQRTAGKNRFTKNGFLVVPLPGHTIRKEKPLFVYFEIYNLSFDESGQTRYQVFYQVHSEAKKKGFIEKIFRRGDEEESSITLSVHGTGVSQQQAEYVAINLDKSNSGRKLLEITVVDLNSSETVASEVPFNLID